MSLQKDTVKIVWEKYKLFFLMLFFNIGFFFLSYMNPIFNFPCKGDTNIYINVAKEMLNGAVLYRDVFDHKGPFIFFIFLFPNIIQNPNWGLFIIDIVLFNVIIWFNLKTIILKRNCITAYLLIIIEMVLLLFSYISASPELIALTIISYANYWIISEKYLSANKYELLLAGSLVGILFWTKYTLCLYLLVVYIYFLVKKCSIKNILYPVLGFLIPTTIVFCYFFLCGALSDLIQCYFIINIGYKNTDAFVFSFGLILLLTITMFICLYSLIKKDWNILILSIAHMALTIPVFFMTGYNWENLYTPFISVVSLLSIFNLDKIKKIAVLLCVLLTVLMGYMLYTASLGNILAGQAYRQLDSFAEDVNQSRGSVMVFQTEPVLPWDVKEIGYKYFFAPTLTYEQHPEMYEQIYHDISNKNLDYILVILDEDGKIMPLSHFRTATAGEIKTLEWVEKISEKIYENYKIHGNYYKFTVFSVNQGG